MTSAPKPVCDLSQAQLYAADIYVSEREGELVYADAITGREMNAGELVPLPEASAEDPEPEAEAGL